MARAAARFLGLDFEIRFTGLEEFRRFVSDRGAGDGRAACG